MSAPRSFLPSLPSNSISGSSEEEEGNELSPAETVSEVFTTLSLALAALDALTPLTDRNFNISRHHNFNNNNNINKRSGNNNNNNNNNKRNNKNDSGNNGTWTAELVTLLSSYLLEELDGNI